MVPQAKAGDMSYRVIFQKRDFSRTSQPGLRFTVEKMRWSCFGGCERALLRAEGNPTALEDLKHWLRYPVTIFNEQDAPVWWGFMWSVKIFGAGCAETETMEGMANKIAVFHTSLAPLDQPEDSNLTAWAEDSTSQARYGVIEKVIRRQNIDDSFAEQLRDISLQELKDPQVRLDPLIGEEGFAEMECRGWMSTLDWKVYQNTGGMIANTVGQDGTQILGSSSSYARLAQSIQNSTALTVNSVDVRVRRQGSPIDNLALAVQADSGGQPSGTDLRSASVAGSSLENERYPWVRFSFSKPVSIAAGTPYWLVLTRSGSYSGSDHYVFGVDEKLSYPDGTFRIYNASISAWAPRTPTCDLIFRVLGTSLTTQQLNDIYTIGNQFFTGMDLRINSGINTPAYEVGYDSCLKEFERLLELGTSNNRLMNAWVNEDLKVIIREQAQKGTRDHFIDEKGRFYDQYGNRMLGGVVPVGEWVKMKAGHGTEKPAVFVKSIEISGANGQTKIN